MEKISSPKSRNASLRRPSLLSWLHILRIQARIDQISAAHFAQAGLSSAQFDVIAQVGSAEGISQLDLARHLFVTQGNITQLLAKMESRGWIRRVADGRSKRLYLTAEGRVLFDSLVPAQEDFIAGRFDALTPDEQRQLLRLLSKLDHAQR